MTESFRRAGIEQIVEEGPSWIELEIETPRGPVTFANQGESLVGFGSFMKMTGPFYDYLVS